jgi:hypothetical protein
MITGRMLIGLKYDSVSCGGLNGDLGINRGTPNGTSPLSAAAPKVPPHVRVSACGTQNELVLKGFEY